MAKKYWFEVPCPHGENLRTIHTPTLPNYHSLSRGEVAKILDFMLENKRNVEAWARAAIRLADGIQGITCPYSADGRAAQNHIDLDKLLADTVEEGGTPQKVQKVMNLLES